VGLHFQVSVPHVTLVRKLRQRADHDECAFSFVQSLCLILDAGSEGKRVADREGRVVAGEAIGIGIKDRGIQADDRCGEKDFETLREPRNRAKRMPLMAWSVTAANIWNGGSIEYRRLIVPALFVSSWWLCCGARRVSKAEWDENSERVVTRKAASRLAAGVHGNGLGQELYQEIKTRVAVQRGIHIT
jgi:hypothetical protein